MHNFVVHSNEGTCRKRERLGLDQVIIHVKNNLNLYSTPNMNKIRIKPHRPEGEDDYTLPSLYSSVFVTILLLHSLPALSLATMLTAAGDHNSSNEGGCLQLFRWGADTGVSNLTYSSGLPNDSIITSPDKAAVFP